MSALDQALRKAEQQHQNADENQERHADGSLAWKLLALVFFVLIMLGGGLVFSDLLPMPQKTVSRSSHSGKVQDNLTPPPPLALSMAVEDSAQESLTLASFSSPTSSTLAEPTSVPASAATGKKFTFPAWHKSGERLWSWGLWASASRAWLKGLQPEDPGLPLLLIADKQTLAQATRQYQAWAAHFPVVVVPKKATDQKLWLVLAVPAADELERARHLLLLAQGQTATVSILAQWQSSFESIDMIDVSSPKSQAALASSAALSTPPSAASATSPLPARAVPVSKAAAADLPVNDVDSKKAAASAGDAEPPQLSRTNAERLSRTGPVSPAAKAIDVEFQAIEKSLARGEHQEAWDAVVKLEKYIGRNWRTQYLAGVSLMGLARWDQATTALAKAQELNPGHTLVALYHSLALQERGEHAKAIQVLLKALDTQPQSPELWLNQAHSYQALGQKTEASKAYSRFMELSVQRPDLAEQRAWVNSRLQKDKG
jgi:tetratricopeptide (TPR) repeat protein